VVAEADESDRSFLYLRPQAAVVTNVEFDHPDFYDSLDDVIETFGKFLDALPPEATSSPAQTTPCACGSRRTRPAPSLPTASRAATCGQR
jgi:UDP-N-acetylmuramate-alanine ligase